MWFNDQCGANSNALRRALPAGLLILALATVFAFPGYDRGQFHRSTEHNALSRNHMAVAANLSWEHGFLQFTRQHFDSEGELTYEGYGRFPLLGYVLIKLVGLPFGDSLSARLYAARMLVLTFFAAAMVLAYLSLRLLLAGGNGHRAGAREQRGAGTALAATMLAFSSYPLLYYSDIVTPEAAMGLFSVLLAFHGVAVYLHGRCIRTGAGAQASGCGQLCVKTCAALLFDWHVYGLLLPLLLVALPQAVCTRDWRRCRHWVLVGVAALVTGLAILAFNFGREYHALGGTTPFFELPSVDSMLRRTGLTPLRPLAWEVAIQEQLRRVGEAALPWALVAPLDGWLEGRWQRVGGVCLAVAALLICIPGTRHRAAWSGLALCGMGWALPMRHQAHENQFEALFHVGAPLVVCALVLMRLRRFAPMRARPASGALRTAVVGTAFALFVTSNWLMRLVSDDAEVLQMERVVLADMVDIRRHAQGKVVYVPKTVLDWNPCCRMVYLTGSVMVREKWPTPDVVVATDIPRSDPKRPPPSNSPASRSLTPNNRLLFLYEWDVYRKELAAARGVYERHADTSDPPAIRSRWAVHHLDDALLYVGEGGTCSDSNDPKFFLHVYPVDWNDVPERSRRDGFVKIWVRRDRDWFNNGRCFALAFLPDFPIGTIHTGQFAEPGNPNVWEGRLFPRERWLPNGEEVAGMRRQYERIAAGEPAERAAWNVHLLPRADGGREIAFLKAPCGRDDAAGRFFLHTVPVDLDILPVPGRRLGFDNWDFDFRERGGVLFDGKCIVRVRLPDYDIANVRTGQYDATVGELWRVEFPVPLAVH